MQLARQQCEKVTERIPALWYDQATINEREVDEYVGRMPGETQNSYDH